MKYDKNDWDKMHLKPLIPDELKDFNFLVNIGIPSSPNLLLCLSLNAKDKILLNETEYLKIGGDNGLEYGIIMALQLSTMKVYQIDINELQILRLVNNSISSLVQYLFYWELIPKKVEERPIAQVLHNLKSTYNQIDKKILLDENSYWSLLIEDIETNY